VELPDRSGSREFPLQTGLSGCDALLHLQQKIAPSVAAGNAIILKTSEKAPFAVAKLGALIKEAGFPAGVVQIIHGKGDVGQLLSEHMKIRKVSFTGSTRTGRAGPSRIF
jgi:aldehyde dehydrogenase (NAD+)